MSLVEKFTDEQDIFVEQVAFGTDGIMVTYSDRNKQNENGPTQVNDTWHIPYTGQNALERENLFCDMQSMLRWLLTDAWEEETDIIQARLRGEPNQV